MSLPNEENAEKEAVGSSIDFTRVHDDEFLFRAVPNQPSFIKEDGSVTSAALKDSHGGVSVDRAAIFRQYVRSSNLIQS